MRKEKYYGRVINNMLLDEIRGRNTLEGEKKLQGLRDLGLISERKVEENGQKVIGVVDQTTARQAGVGFK